MHVHMSAWACVNIHAPRVILAHRVSAYVDDVAARPERGVRAPARPHLPGVAPVGEVLPLVAVLDDERLATPVEELRAERHARVHVHVHVHVLMIVLMLVLLLMRVPVPVHIHMLVHVHACVRACVHACMRACVYVYMCACVNMCTYVHVQVLLRCPTSVYICARACACACTCVHVQVLLQSPTLVASVAGNSSMYAS